MEVEIFCFNDFGVNTYVLYDETKECLIIDPGCVYENEKKKFSDYIKAKNLKPILIVNTHGHIDHILGNGFCVTKYSVKVASHRNGLPFYKQAKEYAEMFGLHFDEEKMPDIFVKDNEDINFGNTKLKVLETPGHADGSICLYCAKTKMVFTGDVLFAQSIGRTDLPTGNYELLINSIKEKLFSLPDETIVFPGHGPSTTIGKEKKSNPFLI